MSDDDDTIVRARAGDPARLIERLGDLGWSVAVAESLTGGLVVSSLVSVPGASAVVRGGVVAYAADLKHALLGVDAALLAAHGAVHPEVARQMAEGVRRTMGGADGDASLGIATTGVAGPEPADGQAVGTVHVGVSTPLGTTVRSMRLPGDREQIRTAATGAAIRLALAAL